MTLGAGVAPAGALPVTTCIDAGAPNLCAPAGAVELIAITPAMFASFATAQTVGAALSIGLVGQRDPAPAGPRDNHAGRRQQHVRLSLEAY